MPLNPKTKRRLRIAAIIAGSLALVLGGVAWYFASQYEQIIRKKLPLWIASATDSLYTGSIDEISINVFTRKVRLNGLHLTPDSARVRALQATHHAPSSLLDVHIPEVAVSGIVWKELLGNDKEVVVSSVIISRPEIMVTALPKDTLHIADTAEKKGGIDRIAAANISVRDADVTYRKKGGNDTQIVRLRKATVDLTNWEYRPKVPPDTTRFFYAERGVINVDTCLFENKNANYKMALGGISFDTKAQTATLRDFVLKPSMGRAALYKRIGHQSDIFNVHFPLIELQGFAWKELLYRQRLVVDSIAISDGQFADYFSRYAPPSTESKLGKYPHQLLLNAKLPIAINTIIMKRGSVTYTELNDKSGREGVVRFGGMSGVIRNATNMPERIAKNARCTINMQCAFMGSSPMSAQFNLSLSDASGAFSMDAQLGNVQAGQIKETVRALALAELESWNISKANIHVEGNEREGSGSITLLYDNLKVTLQKVETEDGKKTLEDRGFLSFLTNKLIIHDANPKEGEEVRLGTSYVPRDPTKSFFSLIWKNMLSSMIQVIIKNDKIADAFAEKQEKGKNPGGRPEEKKKGLLKKIFGGGDKDKKKDKK